MPIEIMTHIYLSHASGGGFWGTLMPSRHATIGTYMGDVGVRSRAFWRTYAKRNGYLLVETE